MIPANDCDNYDRVATVCSMLARGPVLLHIRPELGCEGLPADSVGLGRLILRVGHGLVPAIPDLVVDDAGVTGTLHFSGRPHACFMPWRAIFGASADGRGVLWVENMPAGPAPGEAPVVPPVPESPLKLVP